MTRQEILELIETVAEGAQVAVLDDMDEACLGIALTATPHLVYSRSKCIKVLQESGMSQDEAEEYFEYSTARSLPYMGENNPVIVEP